MIKYGGVGKKTSKCPVFGKKPPWKTQSLGEKASDKQLKTYIEQFGGLNNEETTLNIHYTSSRGLPRYYIKEPPDRDLYKCIEL